MRGTFLLPYATLFVTEVKFTLSNAMVIRKGLLASIRLQSLIRYANMFQLLPCLRMSASTESGKYQTVFRSNKVRIASSTLTKLTT